MPKEMNAENIQASLDEAVALARNNHEGKQADYIPELAETSDSLTAVAFHRANGECYLSGDIHEKFTLQSVAKVIVLIGMLEEFGVERVYSWVHFEPSGDDFSSIARLDQFGPVPSNPFLNSGAIALTAQIPGNFEQRLSWIEKWNQILFGENLTINTKVFASERRTGDRNRALAYLLKSTGLIDGDINEILEAYFALCSFETSVGRAAYLPMLLANQGIAPDGRRVISLQTVRQVVSLMTTCGLYNESGTHLVRTGMPAKSGVSGYILAVAMGHGGIAVVSPRLTRKGTSIRGEIMLEHVSLELGLHFAG